MANRLSEEAVIAAWDSGHQSLEWTVDKGPMTLAPVVDFKALLAAEDPAAAVQAVDRRDMYLAIVNADPEEALEVMPLLSKEQFVAIIDYEGWHQSRLSVHNVIRWLDVYKSLGVDQMFRRFRELDEEYQTGLLCPYIDIRDEEEFEALGGDEQDQYHELPCHTLWYRVKGGDDKVEEFVTSLVLGGLGEDVPYIYSLLSHASYLPPNEQEDLLVQFRTARLEEDGFVSADDSRALFMPFNGKAVADRWTMASDTTAIVGEWNGPGIFLDAVLTHIKQSPQFDMEVADNLRRSFATLANMLAAASHVQPDEVQALTKLFDHSRHLVSLGLEALSQGQVARGAEILLTERPVTVFQFAIATVDTVRESALEIIKENDWPGYEDLSRLYSIRRYGGLMWQIDTQLLVAAGFEAVEMLKGLFNRLPMIADEIQTEDKVKRCKFRPVGRVSDLKVLGAAVDAMRHHGREVLEPVTQSGEASH